MIALPLAVFVLTAAPAPTPKPPSDLNIGNVEDFLFSPSGKALLVMGSSGVAVVDPTSLTVFHRLPERVPNDRVLFSSDGKLVALAPCSVHLFPTTAAGQPLVLQCPTSPQGACARALIFAPSDPSVFLGCADGSVTRRSLKDGSILSSATTLPDANTLSALPGSPEGRVVPAFSQGRFIGVKMFSIRKGSIYDEALLQNGDILVKINGQTIEKGQDAATILLLLHDVKGTLEVIRNGAPLTLTVPGPASDAAK